MIKPNKTGAYVKLLECWNARPLEERKTWMDFRQHAIAEYEKLLAEGAGVTTGDEGFPTAFHATNNTDTDDTSSLAESVVRFAERASEAQVKVGTLEDRLRTMETKTSPIIRSSYTRWSNSTKREPT